MSDASEKGTPVEANADVLEVRQLVDGYDTHRVDEVRCRVRRCISETLNVADDGRLDRASLIEDLGAESLDFLDLEFRLEEEFGFKLPYASIPQLVERGLDSWAEPDGRLCVAALERLHLLLPEVAPDRISSGLRSHDIPGLFTAETFVRLVLWHQAIQERAATET